MVWGRLIFLLYWGSNPGTLVQWKVLQNTGTQAREERHLHPHPTYRTLSMCKR
ncbi:rCG30509 [Rattus norvegicus]|uniref:RCG30509 n=1 Tax=Rattus norvegicus TaxID=10116 RepID=A6JFT0_RAT|nr:rCG30509 [Rattus norvegicus]